MKIQGLAVLSMLLIIPMSIILNVYSSYQIRTLQNQIEYDTKLNNATYDAIKAFQMNMSNSSSAMIMDSKLRDMTAGIKTFYNSLSSHFDMTGYGESVLQEYVPAIVFTLYDGYYIYSSYENKLDEDDKFYTNSAYKEEKMYGLKPYIYYSCRYKNGDNNDFVITYSLDSYITVQGIVNGKNTNTSGYVLRKLTKTGSDYKYNGFTIWQENDKEAFKQYAFILPDGVKASEAININLLDEHEGINVKNEAGVNEIAGYIVKSTCNKVNGTKYYKVGNEVFSILNDSVRKQTNMDGNKIAQNQNGIAFYKDAFEFTKWVNDNLSWLKPSHAVDEQGRPFSGDDNPYAGVNGNIFNVSGQNEEDKNSNFSAHKMAVIKNVVEKNLGIAISQYNSVSNSEANFVMPKLQETDWENIANNVTMITFLQGLSIGGKIYNGYSIVPNTLTNDYVSEDSIYMVSDGQYRSVRDPDLLDTSKVNLSNVVGLFNTDFERRTSVAYLDDLHQNNIYYYPRVDTASYKSVVNPNGANIIENQTIDEYLTSKNGTAQGRQLGSIYYTALGRERYGMYRANRETSEMEKNANLLK